MVELVIKNEVGLHARPAAQFCTEAKKFTADISISKDGKAFDAKSIIMVMSAGIENGDKVAIEATGSDASAAEKALAEFLNTLEG